MIWKRVCTWACGWATSFLLVSGCGTASHGGAPSASAQGHRSSPSSASGTAVQNRHILLEPLPQGVRTTTDLYNWLLNQRLAQMDNPAQGEICLDSACKVAATVFSGPTKSKAGTPLALVAFEPRTGWHVLVGPLPQADNPPRQAQLLNARLDNYPRPQGVCVVDGGEMDWYWIASGHLQVMRQPRT
ncbi:hypothetical protein IW967_07440 [Alicyclobacillus mali]|uniref:Lipoprotein n=2 Tax=Alicyclobacillus mali (ex Roth et al. 2021) TaxID=1123961 RepID=A0ABS0F367_9BACL|nr:hypothetical protein [Alicyclobacillus mali (ex Roth et al. 2021)]MCL6488681.1 hypothetical protein [Alicyclobacillus mali (ex Roth et al. 2021)]